LVAGSSLARPTVKGLVAGLPGPDKYHKAAVLPAFYRRAAGVGLAS
jgi:hypothetical protein